MCASTPANPAEPPPVLPDPAPEQHSPAHTPTHIHPPTHPPKERGRAARRARVQGGGRRGAGCRPRAAAAVQSRSRAVLDVGPDGSHRLPRLPRAHGWVEGWGLEWVLMVGVVGGGLAGEGGASSPRRCMPSQRAGRQHAPAPRMPAVLPPDTPPPPPPTHRLCRQGAGGRVHPQTPMTHPSPPPPPPHTQAMPTGSWWSSAPPTACFCSRRGRRR